MSRIPATATVLTFNSSRSLEACLASLRDFAEVLVLDGGSTDATVAIARRHGARVEPQSETPGPIGDFTAVRERSFARAAHDWVFWLDSDERIDAALADAIRAAVAADRAGVAYRASRLPIVEGRLIRHASFLPDRVLRLVRKSEAHWAPGKAVHERLVVPEGARIEDLAGTVLTSWPDLAACRTKDRRYLHLAFARSLARRPALGVTLRSVVKNAARAARILCAAAVFRVRYGRRGAVLPWPYERRFVRYHLAVARERIRQFVLATRYAPPSP